jgi:hypothetical protein
MRDDHLYRVLHKDTWIIDIIQSIRKMPLDNLDKNTKRRIVSESQNTFGILLISSNLAMMESWEGACQEKRG